MKIDHGDLGASRPRAPPIHEFFTYINDSWSQSLVQNGQICRVAVRTMSELGLNFLLLPFYVRVGASH